MSIGQMRNVLEILKGHIEDNKYFDSNHDIIYIPWFEQEGDVAENLEKIGCHWDIEAESWASF